MAKEYTNLFQFKNLQNVPKLEIFVGKYTIWQPWMSLKNSDRSIALATFQKLSTPARSRVARFFLVQHTKWVKNVPK
jgi:hypothetical protein